MIDGVNGALAHLVIEGLDANHFRYRFEVMNLKRENSSAHGISASVASLVKHEPWEGAPGETMAIAATRDVKRISSWS